MLTSAVFHPSNENVVLIGTMSKGIFAIDTRENKV